MKSSTPRRFFVIVIVAVVLWPTEETTGTFVKN